VRVLYTDIDGTLVGPGGNLLLDDDMQWTTAAADALVRAHRAGLAIVALSGRRIGTLNELGRLLGMPAWIGELGGVRVYNRGTEVIVDEGEYPGGRPVVEVLTEAMTALVAARPGFLTPHSPWNEGRLVSVMVRGELDTDTTNAWLADNGLAWAHAVDNGVIPRPFEDLPHVDEVHVYHLTPRGLSKHAAIVADQHHRGIDPSECAVVGDALADLACAPHVDRCFIVRNAVDKDRVMAEAVAAVPNAYVTKRGHGDGFAQAVDELLS